MAKMLSAVLARFRPEMQKLPRPKPLTAIAAMANGTEFSAPVKPLQLMTRHKGVNQLMAQSHL